MRPALPILVLTALGLPTATPSAQQTPPKLEELALAAAGAVGGEELGRSVVVSGDTAVAGAPQDDGLGSLAGAATVFERQGSDWLEVQRLTASDGASGDILGRSVGLSGDVLALGAPFDDDDGSSSGSVYVFERQAGSFVEVAKLTASDAAGFAQFGMSVAVDGELMVVGAVGDDEAGFFAGAAYVFERQAGVWTEIAKLTASDGAANEVFGVSVDLDGERLVVGAHGTPSTASVSGAAYVFERQAGAFVEMARLALPDVGFGELLGFDVALSGGLALVGAPDFGGLGLDQGRVGVFAEQEGGAWAHVQTLESATPAAEERFGFALDLDGELALVGAPEASVDGQADAGRAELFALVDGLFEPLARLRAAAPGAGGDSLGFAAHLDGPLALVGAPDTDSVSGNDGAVLVYDARLLPFGEGCAPGGGAPPVHRVSGHPVEGAVLTIETSGGTPFAPGLLVVALAPAEAELLDCLLLVDPLTLVPVPLVLDADGAHQLQATLPPGLAGITAASQVLLVDGDAPQGLATSAAVSSTLE